MINKNTKAIILTIPKRGKQRQIIINLKKKKFNKILKIKILYAGKYFCILEYIIVCLDVREMPDL